MFSSIQNLLKANINRVSPIMLRSTSTYRMSPTPWIPNNYPPARRSDHVDEYKSSSKGIVKVADPYQWLEKNTAETDEWTSVQESFTRAYLDVGSLPASIWYLSH